jgi:D-3-phosphoglycerate dehydrogenase
MKKVLIPEELSKEGISKLSEKYEVEYLPDCTRAELLEAVKSTNALIVRSATKVDKEVIAAAKELEVIGRAGVGVDNIDIEAATEAGVMVANAPLSNIVSAAEHALGLLIATARNIPQGHNDLVKGSWNRSKYTGVELAGKTLGILGFGRVGELVARRMISFDMKVICYDPYTTHERAKECAVEKVDTLDELMGRSDFLTIHTPKTEQTANLVNKELLSKAKSNLILINAARGGIVNENDLAEALKTGVIAGAGLDVFSSEPITESPLFSLGNVVVTPHLGASTDEAQENASVAICEQVDLALSGLFVPFALNVDAKSANSQVQAFLGISEIIGKFVGQLCADEEIERVIVEEAGHISQYDCSVLTLALLKGLFNSDGNSNASFVNSKNLAAEKNIKVEERTKSNSIYTNRVRLKAVTKSGKKYSVTGAFSGLEGEPMIVEIDRHKVSIPPVHNMLVVVNDNIPGMVGHVGNAIGENELNIADMSLSKSKEDNEALMVFAMDSELGNIKSDLLKIDGIRSVFEISL